MTKLERRPQRYRIPPVTTWVMLRPSLCVELGVPPTDPLPASVIVDGWDDAPKALFSIGARRVRLPGGNRWFSAEDCIETTAPQESKFDARYEDLLDAERRAEQWREQRYRQRRDYKLQHGVAMPRVAGP